MKFAYKKFEFPPGERREFVLKPIIPVFLFRGKSFIRIEALIDSGADFSLFDAELAGLLGIKWNQGVPHTFVGITGSRGKAYFHSMKLKVGSWSQDIVCAFSKNVSAENYGILGQEGFFEHFQVAFDLPRNHIEIKPI